MSDAFSLVLQVDFPTMNHHPLTFPTDYGKWQVVFVSHAKHFR